MAALSVIDTKAASLLLSHEITHSLLDQRPEAQPSLEDLQIFTQACKVMQTSALKHVRDDSAWLIHNLDKLRRLSPQKFAPAYQTLADAIRQGSYNQLPNSYSHLNGNVPACYLHNPWYAFTQNVRATIPTSDEELSSLHDIPDFGVTMNELVAEWNDVIAESVIYSTLSESTYLQGSNHPNIGHPVENKFELEASGGNLLLNLPAEFGDHVNNLPEDLKQATLRVLEATIKNLKQIHKDNAELISFIDKQYAEFLAHAS